MTGIGSMVPVAVLVGPTVLLIARHSVRTVLRLRPIEVTAVSAVAGLMAGLVLALPPERAIVLLPLAVLGCAAAVVDAHEGRLPDVLIWPLLAVTVLAGVSTGVAATAVLSALAGGCVAVMLKMVISAGFGWGDAKLVPTLSVVLVRHDAIVTGVVSMSVLVAVTAFIVGIRATDRSALVPYGPALVVGTVGAATL